MTSRLHNVSVIHNQNTIRSPRRLKTMRNKNDNLSLPLPPQPFEQVIPRHRIQSRSRLIQNDDLCSSIKSTKCPCQSDALPLTGGKISLPGLVFTARYVERRAMTNKRFNIHKLRNSKRF